MTEHWTNKYAGIPFKEHGRTFEGVDCWGLPYLVFPRELSITLPSYVDDYEDIAQGDKLASLYRTEIDKPFSEWIKIEQGKQKEFDILHMPLEGRKTHVAIIVNVDGMLQMMHITEGIAVTIEPFNEARWNHVFNRSDIYRHAIMDERYSRNA